MEQEILKEELDTKQHGVVSWFNEAKGFGFIIQDEPGSDDIFVHYSGLLNADYLQNGDDVTYDIGKGNKGPMAVNVTVG